MTTFHTVTVQDGAVDIFYREAGSPNKPTILLLHGFPSSSHQYRTLIPLLAKDYHVVAPDLPAFGYTEVRSANYQYTFASLTDSIAAFLAVLNIKHCYVYIFDYGAPVGLRLALQNAVKFDAIITQNGNAYDEGLGAQYWAPARKFWASAGSETDRAPIFGRLKLESIKSQYVNGVPSDLLDRIPPETYGLDFFLANKPGRGEGLIDLMYDYRTNVELYPQFQKYIRDSKVPILAVWGKNDPAFIPPGAEAFKRDSPNAQIHFVDTGHFALETNVDEIAAYILPFLAKL